MRIRYHGLYIGLEFAVRDDLADIGRPEGIWLGLAGMKDLRHVLLCTRYGSLAAWRSRTG